jgi:hypothetical protein
LQAINLDLKPVPPIRSRPTPFSITDNGKGRAAVKGDVEAVLHKVEYWHQGSIVAFKIMYRDERGVWDVVRWDGRQAVLKETNMVRGAH